MAKTAQSSSASAPESSLAADAHATDPALLRDHSQFKSYKTSRFEYPEIRVFFRQHVKADQLPKKPAPLPLLVCVPGLGGSVAQFHPLLRSLVDLAPCLAIDWPGGGRSKFAPTQWEAYTSEALMELLEVVIEDHRDKQHGQGVVLMAHSMGTVLSAGLANPKLPHKTSLARHVVGLVAICPVSGPMEESKVKLIKRLFWIPGWIFGLWRMWDGRGGPSSSSVARFVGEAAPEELKLMQYRYNQQSRTPVWRRMAYGALPARYEDGKPIGGIPGSEAWAGLDIPVFLIGGEKDNVTPPTEVDKIVSAFHSLDDSTAHDEDQMPIASELDSPASVNGSTQLEAAADANIDGLNAEDDAEDSDANGPSTPVEHPPDLPPQSQHPLRAVRSIILTGAAANHTLLYSPRTVRALAGLVSDFLADHITQRLSLAWQLQHLSREGKWDVKNLLKWQGVKPVSEPIGPGGNPVFRVTKTLREADDVHCPAVFADNWGHAIKDVIDISKDQPVYDPRGLERRGIHYHKFPTASKIPPEPETVDQFIRLVDAVREAQRERAAAEGWPDPQQCVVGVHCHYGYNRSGYFVVCYLVEKCGFALADAIEAFKAARPNGIRHSHFLDKLYMRYDLEERPTED